ncbi:hypothetical protein TNCV_5059941 [Trichonephila clavipes]|nr:hypothetical protein TNCV_5059941 [Trichonephila clavipes]
MTVPVVQSVHGLYKARFAVWVSEAVDLRGYHCSMLSIELHDLSGQECTEIEDLHAEIVDVEIEVVSPSIVPLGNFAELNHSVTCMVLKAIDKRTSCPCHDEFRGPRSDYVRQVASENNNNNFLL